MTYTSSISWPLFLHVLGAMVLFGALLTAFVLALAGMARGAFTALLIAIPAWALALGAGHWLQHNAGYDHLNPTWLTLGRNILEPGVLILVLAIGAAWWWRSTGKAAAARITAALSGLYLLLLTVAMLAMSGKWGS